MISSSLSLALLALPILRAFALDGASSLSVEALAEGPLSPACASFYEGISTCFETASLNGQESLRRCLCGDDNYPSMTLAKYVYYDDATLSLLIDIETSGFSCLQSQTQLPSTLEDQRNAWESFCSTAPAPESNINALFDKVPILQALAVTSNAIRQDDLSPNPPTPMTLTFKPTLAIQPRAATPTTTTTKASASHHSGGVSTVCSVISVTGTKTATASTHCVVHTPGVNQIFSDISEGVPGKQVGFPVVALVLLAAVLGAGPLLVIA